MHTPSTVNGVLYKDDATGHVAARGGGGLARRRRAAAGGGGVWSGTTDAKGDFAFTQLAPGRYELTVTAERHVEQRVRVVSEQRSLRIVLQPEDAAIRDGLEVLDQDIEALRAALQEDEAEDSPRRSRIRELENERYRLRTGEDPAAPAPVPDGAGSSCGSGASCG